MRKVVVLIESSRAYGRGMLRGVARYNREHGPWSIYFRPQGREDPPPPWLKNWSGDGILARICDRQPPWVSGGGKYSARSGSAGLGRAAAV